MSSRCRIIVGDVLEKMKVIEDDSVNTVITSPPYWGLRSYTDDPDISKNEIGHETTPELYVDKIVSVFDLVRRVLRSDGTIWLNLGDSYGTSGCISGKAGRGANVTSTRKGVQTVTNKLVSGIKQKDLVGIPWRVALALRERGWYLRADIVWHKTNPMPQSRVKDRPSTAHEYLFLLSKSMNYYYDLDAIAEPAKRSPGKMRNRNTVWSFSSQGYRGAHFAVMPPEIVELCVKAGSPRGGVVLDPFCGAGTTLMVANRLRRISIGIELVPKNAEIALDRITKDQQS